MKKSILTILFVGAIILIWSGCQKVLNIPLKGSVSGYVIDEFTNDSIPNVLIEALFTLPDDGTGEERTKTTATTSDGFFHIEDIWDRARVTVSKPGFRTLSFDISIQDDADTTFILKTRGFPKIVGSSFSTKDLSHIENDTMNISVEIEDRYNLAEGTYSAVVFFYDLERDITVASVELSETVQSQSFISLQGQIDVTAFPLLEEDETERVYGYFVEVTDPDENSNEYFNTEADGDIYVSQ